MNEYGKILDRVVSITNKASSLIKGMSDNIVISDKDVNDFVTNVDKASEELIISELKQAFPNYDILAEESGADVMNGDNNRPKWIIDPIDGTTNFTKGIPIYAVSIGLEVDGKIVVGVVNNVPMGEVFTAVADGGAYLNGKKIHVSKTVDIDRLLIGTGFPFIRGSEFKRYMNLFEAFAKSTSGIRRPGSAAIDLCWMACGRYDTFFEFGLHPWDAAAGTLIVKEAGGIVTDAKGGDDFVYGRTILTANNQKVYDFMLDYIDKYYYGDL